MRFVAALIVLLVTVNANALTYYVDVVNGSDANAGTSEGAAWQNLPGTVGTTGSAWVALASGDVAYVRGGFTNNVQWRINTNWFGPGAAFDSVQVVSGHLADPAWGDGRAIIDGESTRTYGIWIGGTNTDGVTIHGFEVRNIAAGGVGVGFDPTDGSACIALGGNGGAVRTTIRGCWLHDALRDANDRGHGIEFSGATDTIIEGNIVGPNIGTKGIETHNSTSGRCHSNFVYDTGDHGIVLTGDGWDCEGNLIYMVPDFQFDPVYSIKVIGDGNDIWNNIVWRDPIAWSPALSNRAQGIGIFEGTSNRIIHNTVINFMNANGREYGTAIAVGSERKFSTNNVVQNNIGAFCRNFYGQVNFFNWSNAVGSDVQYNCWYSTNTATIAVDADDARHTVADLNASGLVSGTFSNNVQKDPGLLSGTLPTNMVGFLPNTDYFKLSRRTPHDVQQTDNAVSGSANYGYDASSDKFDLDIYGNSRTSRWSMGAVEWQQETLDAPIQFF